MPESAPADLQPLPFADAVPADGRDVWTAGYPGLISKPSWQLAKGVVSNRRLTVEALGPSEYAVFTQHSAPIDPDTSGGPLMTGDPADLSRVSDPRQTMDGLAYVRGEADRLLVSLKKEEWECFESARYISSRLAMRQGWSSFMYILDGTGNEEEKNDTGEAYVRAQITPGKDKFRKLTRQYERDFEGLMGNPIRAAAYTKAAREDRLVNVNIDGLKVTVGKKASQTVHYGNMDKANKAATYMALNAASIGYRYNYKALIDFFKANPTIDYTALTMKKATITLKEDKNSDANASVADYKAATAMVYADVVTGATYSDFPHYALELQTAFKMALVQQKAKFKKDHSLRAEKAEVPRGFGLFICTCHSGLPGSFHVADWGKGRIIQIRKKS